MVEVPGGVTTLLASVGEVTAMVDFCEGRHLVSASRRGHSHGRGSGRSRSALTQGIG